MNAALHRFPLAAPAPDEAPLADALRALMDARQTVLPKRLVEPGQIDPDHIITPGIFVDRIVVVDKVDKRIEQRTVRRRAAPVEE